MKTTLLIPTLNEVTGMKVIMPRIKREWYDQLLVVDNGSTDGTIEYCKEKGYPILIQKKKGLRYACLEAYPHIEGDIVITFSPDGNSIPELIPALSEKIKEGYDMVIASRYAKGAKSYDDDIVTGFGNWLFTTVINLLFRAKYTDALVLYRAWRKELFTQLDMDKDSSFSPEEKIFGTIVGIDPLLSVRAAKRKLRCADIPGDEPARIGGVRKLEIMRWGAAYMFEVLKEVFVWR